VLVVGCVCAARGVDGVVGLLPAELAVAADALDEVMRFVVVDRGRVLRLLVVDDVCGSLAR